MKLEKIVRINSIEVNRKVNEIVFGLNVKSIDDNFYNKLVRLYNSSLGYNVKLTLEVEEPILDEAERKYLSDVIRPFRDRVKEIHKRCNAYKEYIEIHLESCEYVNLPYFKKGTMYKGMELNKEYTLEELGL